ncbi:MAG: hypothetical protein M1826_000142 [Phylliscum demangeonii]|nr:MAG: hypothetical protein M1826_000142 [Phylliscum demangeonii]
MASCPFVARLAALVLLLLLLRHLVAAADLSPAAGSAPGQAGDPRHESRFRRRPFPRLQRDAFLFNHAPPPPPLSHANRPSPSRNPPATANGIIVHGPHPPHPPILLAAVAAAHLRSRMPPHDWTSRGGECDADSRDALPIRAGTGSCNAYGPDDPYTCSGGSQESYAKHIVAFPLWFRKKAFGDACWCNRWLSIWRTHPATHEVTHKILAQVVDGCPTKSCTRDNDRIDLSLSAHTDLGGEDCQGILHNLHWAFVD